MISVVFSFRDKLKRLIVDYISRNKNIKIDEDDTIVSIKKYFQERHEEIKNDIYIDLYSILNNIFKNEINDVVFHVRDIIIKKKDIDITDDKD